MYERNMYSSSRTIEVVIATIHKYFIDLNFSCQQTDDILSEYRGKNAL